MFDTTLGDSGRVVFATRFSHQLHDWDVTMTNGWVMGMAHDSLPHCLLSLLDLFGISYTLPPGNLTVCY